MAKTYINHNEVQNMLFGESSLDSKERDVKNVLKQHGIGDEFSYFEKVLANKTISDSEKISTFLESFDLTENSKYQIKKKLNDIMYTEEDEENLEEIPNEETSSEEPESMEDNEDEDLETEDSEEESDEMEDEEESESEEGDINVSDMDLDSKLDLVQKVIDSVSEEDFEDFMNSLTDLLSEYEGSEGDSEDNDSEDSDESEDEEDYPDFEEDEDSEDLEEDDES